MTVIRFKIGEAFPADDPVARFITGLAMISNDWLRSLEDMFGLEGESAEETGRRVSLFVDRPRWSTKRRRSSLMLAGCSRPVARFVDGLDTETRDRCERLIAAVDRAPRATWATGWRATATSPTTTPRCIRTPPGTGMR